MRSGEVAGCTISSSVSFQAPQPNPKLESRHAEQWPASHRRQDFGNTQSRLCLRRRARWSPLRMYE